ncbi:hypothetical protein LCGC14_0842540 [marine sediment metagenome]|uniref:Transcription factor zinc-finger domain-containing protein n=1 Tax=marine sediment metagenome TaxID=412755 RepID=A0A0F9RXB1_9ZZZZ
MNAQETLSELFDIEKCPECHCSTGDDTEFKDFSNKNIIICAQCGNEWYLEAMLEDARLAIS